MLKVRILGDLQLSTDTGTHQVEGSFRKALLVALLVNNDRPVSTETLMYELWRGDRPARPQNALQAHVSRLRRQLDDAEPTRAESRLQHDTFKYRLTLDDCEVDAFEFMRTVRDIKNRDVMSPERVVATLRASLDAWQGPFLGSVVGGEIWRAASERLKHYRLQAYELLFTTELMMGNPAAVIPELSGLLATSTPFHERFCTQLMIALYQSGRQTDALAVYRRVAEQLTDIGIRPSPQLRACEQAVLAQDTNLVTMLISGQDAPAVHADMAVML